MSAVSVPPALTVIVPVPSGHGLFDRSCAKPLPAALVPMLTLPEKLAVAFSPTDHLGDRKELAFLHDLPKIRGEISQRRSRIRCQSAD